MALPEKLTAIADAIREKSGSAVSYKLENMPAAIRALSAPASSGVPDPDEIYRTTRPADWMPLPEPADDEMYLLCQAPEGETTPLSFLFTCPGTFLIELGTIQNGQFDVQYSMEGSSGIWLGYEMDASEWPHATSEGMRQMLVRIYAQGLNQFQSRTHSWKTSPANFAGWNIVDIACRLPSATRILFGSKVANSALAQLRYVTFRGENLMADVSNMFSNCPNLLAVRGLDTSHATTMKSMFENCTNLLAIPELDTSKATDVSSMFYGCRNITFLPEFDLSMATTANSMFQNCNSLKKISLKNTGSVSIMSYLCYDCNALEEITGLDTASATTGAYMFASCKYLRALPALDTSNMTDLHNMFATCSGLMQLPALDLTAATNVSNLFQNCFSLQKVLVTAGEDWAGADLSLLNASLSISAVTAFIEMLPTLPAAKTLTLTGNPGAGQLTASQKSAIAAKNWTLVV